MSDGLDRLLLCCDLDGIILMVIDDADNLVDEMFDVWVGYDEEIDDLVSKVLVIF